METQKTFPLVFSCSGVKVSLHWSPKEKTIDQDLVGFEGSEIEYLFCSENSICSVLKQYLFCSENRGTFGKAFFNN